jgi:hypothetical protein
MARGLEYSWANDKGEFWMAFDLLMRGIHGAVLVGGIREIVGEFVMVEIR